MAGQPQVPGVLEFDVSNLEVSVDPSPSPTNIIPAGANFELRATFGGVAGGMWWEAMKTAGEPFTVEFFAEGLGAAAPDADLGSTPGTLLAADDTYTPVFLVVGGIANTGLYKVACVVTFDDIPGVVGYYDELFVQIY